MAVEQLTRYLERYPDDSEALIAYCRMRPMAPDPDGRQILQTIEALKRLVCIEPTRTEERRALMRLYVERQSYGLAAAEADHLLSVYPRDAEALRVRTMSLLERRLVNDCLDADEQWRGVAPFDLATELAILDLMREKGVTGPRIAARCDAIETGHEYDPAYCVMTAYAYSIAGNVNPEKQTSLLIRAAEKFGTDDACARDGALAASLASQLDRQGRFADSLAVLRRWSAVSKEPKAAWALGTRLFIANQWEQASATFGPPNRDVPAEVLALIEICASRTGRAAGAASARAEFLRRQGNAAAAWSALADWATLPAFSAPSRALSLIDALGKTPAPSPGKTPEFAAIWFYFAGEAEAALGEIDLALQDWRLACSFSPAWATPVVRAVEVLSERGRWTQAMQMADEANRRAPEALAVASVFVETWAAALDRTGPGGIDPGATGPIAESLKPQRLLDVVDSILKQVPDDEAMLCVRAQLLARQESTRARAGDAIDDAIRNHPALSTAAYLRLAGISNAAGLGREQACLVAAERAHGLIPEVALARSLFLLRAGQAAAARQAMEAAVAAHPNKLGAAASSGVLEWEIARTEYLDLAGDKDASAAIVALADAHPDQLAAQRTALHSRAALTDGPLLTRVIERVHRLTGEQGVEWRLARVRMLLVGSPPASEALEETRGLLAYVLKAAPQSVEAHALQARYDEATHDLKGACREWLSAATLAPGAPNLAMSLARALRETGDVSAAARALDALAVYPPAHLPERARLALLLADTGLLDRAIEIMEPALAESGGGSSEAGVLILAELYSRAGRMQDAERLCRGLANPPSLAAVVFTADLLASQGKDAEAKTLLDTLASMHLPVGTGQLAIAAHTLQFHGAEAALPLYQEVCQAAPQNATAWKGFIACCIAAGRAGDAVSAARAGTAALPTDAALHQLSAGPDVLSAAASAPELRPLAAALVQNPAPDAPAVRAVRIAQGKEQSSDAAAVQLADLADNNPTLLPLQGLAFTGDVAANRMNHAVAIATRTANVFPTLADPYRWLFATHAAMGEWERAMAAADLWRARAVRAPPAQAINADLARGQCLVRLDRVSEAVAALEPHADRALADPGANLPWLRVYVAACLAAPQRVGIAPLRDRLTPLLQTPAGCNAWIAVVGEMSNPTDAFDWLAVVSTAAPAQELPQRLVLGAAWQQLAARRPGPECLARARIALTPVINSPNPPPRALLEMAILAEKEGELPVAEAGYRKILNLPGGDDLANVRPLANNNLANLILARTSSGAEMPQALNLAAQAVAAKGNVAAFHDTLAAIYSRQLEYGHAVAELRLAVRLQPAARYRLRLSQALADSGDYIGARKLAQEIKIDMTTDQSKAGALSDSERLQLTRLTQLPDRKTAAPASAEAP